MPEGKQIDWNGTGLPPVGAVCEVNHYGWRKCEVFAHKKSSGNLDALFSYDSDENLQDWNWYGDPNKFRPIRTPEQIAAEEMEKAIVEMYDAVYPGPTAPSEARSVFVALYAAGYRKTKGEA